MHRPSNKIAGTNRLQKKENLTNRELISTNYQSNQIDEPKQQATIVLNLNNKSHISIDKSLINQLKPKLEQIFKDAFHKQASEAILNSKTSFLTEEQNNKKKKNIFNNNNNRTDVYPEETKDLLIQQNDDFTAALGQLLLQKEAKELTNDILNKLAQNQLILQQQNQQKLQNAQIDKISSQQNNQIHQQLNKLEKIDNQNQITNESQQLIKDQIKKMEQQTINQQQTPTSNSQFQNPIFSSSFQFSTPQQNNSDKKETSASSLKINKNNLDHKHNLSCNQFTIFQYNGESSPETQIKNKIYIEQQIKEDQIINPNLNTSDNSEDINIKQNMQQISFDIYKVNTSQDQLDKKNNDLKSNNAQNIINLNNQQLLLNTNILNTSTGSANQSPNFNHNQSPLQDEDNNKNVPQLISTFAQQIELHQKQLQNELNKQKEFNNNCNDRLRTLMPSQSDDSFITQRARSSTFDLVAQSNNNGQQAQSSKLNHSNKLKELRNKKKIQKGEEQDLTPPISPAGSTAKVLQKYITNKNERRSSFASQNTPSPRMSPDINNLKISKKKNFFQEPQCNFPSNKQLDKFDQKDNQQQRPISPGQQIKRLHNLFQLRQEKLLNVPPLFIKGQAFSPERLSHSNLSCFEVIQEQLEPIIKKKIQFDKDLKIPIYKNQLSKSCDDQFCQNQLKNKVLQDLKQTEQSSINSEINAQLPSLKINLAQVKEQNSIYHQKSKSLRPEPDATPTFKL